MEAFDQQRAALGEFMALGARKKPGKPGISRRSIFCIATLRAPGGQGVPRTRIQECPFYAEFHRLVSSSMRPTHNPTTVEEGSLEGEG
jgi:hypothetical protein